MTRELFGMTILLMLQGQMSNNMGLYEITYFIYSLLEIENKLGKTAES